MNWVTYETAKGGILKVQACHIVAIYDEQGVVILGYTGFIGCKEAIEKRVIKSPRLS